MAAVAAHTPDPRKNQLLAALPDAESKIWHRHPVWLLAGNPIVGYVKRKADLRLLFWSGQSFDEPGLTPEGTFKAAEARYTSRADIDLVALERWLAKARTIQWDYGIRVGSTNRIGGGARGEAAVAAAACEAGLATLQRIVAELRG